MGRSAESYGKTSGTFSSAWYDLYVCLSVKSSRVTLPQPVRVTSCSSLLSLLSTLMGASVEEVLLWNVADWQIPQQPETGVALLIPGLRSRSVACSQFQMFLCREMCSACRPLGSPGGGNIASEALEFFFFFSFNQRGNLMICHLILLKSPVISMMNRQLGVMLVLRKRQHCRSWGEEIACWHAGDASSECIFSILMYTN